MPRSVLRNLHGGCIRVCRIAWKSHDSRGRACSPSVAVVASLCRPSRRNAITGSMMCELLDFVRYLQLRINSADLASITRMHPRAVVLRGCDGSFCSGADLSAVQPTQEVGRAMNAIMTEALDGMRSLAVPKVALVEGHALGGGAELLTAADLRIMTPEARLRFLQRKMGVSTGWGGTRRLVSIVGEQQARRLLLGSAPLDGAAALEAGLADRVLPAASNCPPLPLSVATETGVQPSDLPPAGAPAAPGRQPEGTHDPNGAALLQEIPLLWAGPPPAETGTGTDSDMPQPEASAAEAWLPSAVRESIDGLLGGAGSHPAPLWGAMRALQGGAAQEREAFLQLWGGAANLEALQEAGRL